METTVLRIKAKQIKRLLTLYAYYITLFFFVALKSRGNLHKTL